MADKKFINKMFDDIAPTYDQLNHLLSFDVDKSWRRKAVRTILSIHPEVVADLACGTGDFAIALAKAGVSKVLGYDISEGMLKYGNAKLRKMLLDKQVIMQMSDAENLPLEDDSVDAVSIAFGIRNFEHKEIGLSEMHRIIRPGGMVCILELSVPQNPLLQALYKIYFLHVLPFFGGLISGNRQAYKYLPNSVMAFPKPNEFMEMMRGAGFCNVTAKAFTFGLCRMYIGRV